MKESGDGGEGGFSTGVSSRMSGGENKDLLPGHDDRRGKRVLREPLDEARSPSNQSL